MCVCVCVREREILHTGGGVCGFPPLFCLTLFSVLLSVRIGCLLTFLHGDIKVELQTVLYCVHCYLCLERYCEATLTRVIIYF